MKEQTHRRRNRALGLGSWRGLLAVWVLVSSGCVATVYDKPGPLLVDPDSGRRARQYFMGQRLWTLGEKFDIRDERGEPVFFVQGKILSLGDQLTFFDRNGNRFAFIKQVLFSFKHRYQIYRNERLFANMKKRFTIFKDQFVIDVPGPDDYFVNGDFHDYHYIFRRRGKTVAVISKRWPAFGDQYRIEIVPGEDDIIILAAAVVIDMVSHGDEEDHAQP